MFPGSFDEVIKNTKIKKCLVHRGVFGLVQVPLRDEVIQNGLIFFPNLL